MKKLISISCLVLLSTFAQAQFFSRYYYMFNNDYSYKQGKLVPDKKYLSNKVRQIIIKKKDKKKDSYQTYENSDISAAGVVVSNIFYNKKGKITRQYKYHLIDSIHFNKFTSIFKNDTFVKTYDFNDKMLLTNVKSFSKDNKLYFTNSLAYNESNKLSSSIGINRKGKQTFRYEYSFYENGSRKETRYFNKKNVLKQVWNYACEPTGVVEKKVAQNNICKKRTYNPDSSYYEIFEDSDNKGITYRKTVKYSKDSLELESIYYNKKNKETYHSIYEYNSKREQVSVKNLYKGKLKDTFYNKYAANGLAESYKRVSAKGKVMYDYIYEYHNF